MMNQKDGKNEDKKTYRYSFVIEKISPKNRIKFFQKDLYKRSLKDFGIYFITIKRQKFWMDKFFMDI